MPPDQLFTTVEGARLAYAQAIELFLGGARDDAIAAFRSALEADEDLAVAHVGLGVALHCVSPNSEVVDVAIQRATRRRDISRRERQHVTVVAQALAGRLARASALGREHLAEFPDDALVLYVLTNVCGDDDEVWRA